MILQLSFMVLFVVVILFLASVNERQKMRHFLQRGCTGFRWRRRFPQASKGEIREFLDILVDSFGYKQSWRLNFAPEDRVMELYRVRYPVRGEPDGMELEGLVRNLQKCYGVDANSFWREDVTLADLFASVRCPKG